jgi:hypothetical protein
VPVCLANVSQQIYQLARAASLAKEDSAAIVKVDAEMAGEARSRAKLGVELNSSCPDSRARYWARA